MGQVPDIDDPKHEEFTQQVKLEPFKRAMEEIKPDLCVSGINHGSNNSEII